MSENNGNGRWLSPEEAIAAGLADRVIEPARQAGNTLTQNIARGWKRLLAELGVKSGPQPAADRNILHFEAEMRELRRRSSIVAEETRRRIAPPACGALRRPLLRRNHPLGKRTRLCRGCQVFPQLTPPRIRKKKEAEGFSRRRILSTTLKKNKTMTYLENAKQYTGSDLENIFFRPILTGQSAEGARRPRPLQHAAGRPHPTLGRTAEHPSEVHRSRMDRAAAPPSASKRRSTSSA